MLGKSDKPRGVCGEMVLSSGEILDDVPWDWVIVCTDPQDDKYVIIACTSQEVQQPVRRVSRKSILKSFSLIKNEQQFSPEELREKEREVLALEELEEIVIWGDR